MTVGTLPTRFNAQVHKLTATDVDSVNVHLLYGTETRNLWMTSISAHARERYRRYVVLAAVVLLLASCSGGSGSNDLSSPSSTTSPSRVLEPEEFAAFIAANPDVPLINVHVPYEGHIEGTDNFVAFDEIGDWDRLPADKEAPLIIYCRSGNMSATAAKKLAEMGYRNIVDLEGGMNAWSAAGYDLLTDQREPS